jgi:hypothetical protein
MEVMKEIVVRVILRLQLVDGKFDLDKDKNNLISLFFTHRYDNSFGIHKWTRKIALETNISNDVTLGSSDGTLLFFGSAPGSFSGVARFVSPSLSQSGVQCEIEFYFYKSDSNVASLGLYILNDDFSTSERLWLTTGTSSNSAWTKTVIGINRRANRFKIYFEGIQMVSQFNTQLAIDDVDFKNCQSLSTTNIITTSTTTLSTSSSASSIQTPVTTTTTITNVPTQSTLTTTLSACPNNDCQNGGSCTYVQESNLCKCQCKCLEGFSGDKCEVRIESKKKCKN